MRLIAYIGAIEMGSMPQERRLKGKHTACSLPAPELTRSVIIVGAGLGGCATALAMNHVGFDVVVYEKVRQFKRLGDSLGLGENALKLLDRWSPGLRDDFVAIGNKSQYMQIRRWENGELLAQQELMDMAGFIGHRGDYHDAFLRAVKSARIPLNMGQEVIQFVDGRPPSVELADGRIEHADVVIAADGIKSRARELVLGYADRPKSSGYACFRAFFDSEALKDDPVCNKYLQEECVNFWIGDDVHLVQNTLRNGQEFNWILTHKDTEDIEESWFQPGDLNQVKALITDLDPDIAGAVRMTPECLDWKICYRDPIPTWVSDNHHIALLGDCCHPHLPTSAQVRGRTRER